MCPVQINPGHGWCRDFQGEDVFEYHGSKVGDMIWRRLKAPVSAIAVERKRLQKISAGSDMEIKA